MCLQWFNCFDIKNLQFEEGRRQNQILIICGHRSPIEEEELSKDFRRTMKDVNFKFKNLKTSLDGYQIYDEMRDLNCYTSIIFAVCNQDTCDQCKDAKYFKHHLSDLSVIYKEPERDQFPVRNIFFRKSGGKLIYSRVITSGTGWKLYLQEMVDKRKILNSSKTNILVLSGGHSSFDDPKLDDWEILEDDYKIKRELRKSKTTCKINIDIVDLKSFDGKIQRLSSHIKRGRYKYIVMAFCHSFYSKLKQKLAQEGIKYTILKWFSTTHVPNALMSRIVLKIEVLPN